MHLTDTDRTLAAGFAGPDPFEPANDSPILFHLTIRQYDGTLIGESGRFVDSIAAQQFGEERGGLGCRVTVRPDVETSYLHGRMRYPNALHPQASQESIDGYADAMAIAYAKGKLAVNQRNAERLQQRQQDIADVIGHRS